MPIYYCNKCFKEYNNIDLKPLSLPCGDVFCQQCIYELYDKKNHNIICPIHKKEISIEFNKIPICSKILVNLKKKSNIEPKDNSLYCIRHSQNKVKYFCGQDKAFLCDNCLSQHNGHKYVEFKLNKENFTYEINTLKSNFENLKNKYLSDKHRINSLISFANKHIDDQIVKINNYFNSLINIINDKKNKYILKLNNISKENTKKIDKIQNIFSISDEKYSFINNEFYYIINDLLYKGEYETFYNLKNNFIEEIQNFEKYININIFKNNELFFNNKLPTFIKPKFGIIEKNNNEKEEEIFGKFEDRTIDIEKSGNNSPRKKKDNNDINNNANNSKFIEKEKVIINNSNNDKENINDNSLNNIINNNLDSSLITKKSNLNCGNSINNDSSFIEKQLIETGFTFFLMNKNDVKNVFKQQESEQSQNELLNLGNNNKNINSSKNDINEIFFKEQNNNSVNKNYNKNNYINNLNNINSLKNNNKMIVNNSTIINNNSLNCNKGNQNSKNNNHQNNNYISSNNNYNNNQASNNPNNNNNKNNNILSNLNNFNISSGKKPYKLLNINNNIKDNNYYKKDKDKKHNYHRINKVKDSNQKNNIDYFDSIQREIPSKKPYLEKEKSSFLISYNNISSEKSKNIKVNKSEDNYKNKIVKTKINILSNKRDNSTKRSENQDQNSNSKNSKRMHIIRGNSFNKNINNNDKKSQISYIYANMNNSLMNNNLISSYNKEYSNDYSMFNKNNNNISKEKKNYKNIIQNGFNMNKYNSQILTEMSDEYYYKNNLKDQKKQNNHGLISEKIFSPDKNNKDNENIFLNKIKHKKASQPKYTLKDMNIRNDNNINFHYENNRFNENKNNNYRYKMKRGRSTRQKYSNSELNSVEMIY